MFSKSKTVLASNYWWYQNCRDSFWCMLQLKIHRSVQYLSKCTTGIMWCKSDLKRLLLVGKFAWAHCPGKAYVLETVIWHTQAVWAVSKAPHKLLMPSLCCCESHIQECSPNTTRKSRGGDVGYVELPQKLPTNNTNYYLLHEQSICKRLMLFFLGNIKNFHRIVRYEIKIFSQQCVYFLQHTCSERNAQFLFNKIRTNIWMETSGKSNICSNFAFIRMMLRFFQVLVN